MEVFKITTNNMINLTVGNLIITSKKVMKFQTKALTIFQRPQFRNNFLRKTVQKY